MTTSKTAQLFDLMVLHQIGLMKFSNGLSKDLVRIIDDSEKELNSIIFTQLDGEVVGKLRSFQRLVSKLRKGSFKRINRIWLKASEDLVKQEADFILNATRTDSIGAKAIPLFPRSLNNIIKDTVVHGQKLGEWQQIIADSDFTRIDQQVKIGLVQGETASQIKRRITGTTSLRKLDGVTQITRKNLTNTVRTSINAHANVTRRKFFQENNHLFADEAYVAVLDGKTTLLCAGLDGKFFPLGEGPIPPLHISCRSMRVPRFKRDTRQMLPRPTYQEWLKDQPRTVQEDILGKTKARLFRDGQLKLNKFVDKQGNELNLRELAAKDAEAFRRANLNPEEV